MVNKECIHGGVKLAVGTGPRPPSVLESGSVFQLYQRHVAMPGLKGSHAGLASKYVSPLPTLLESEMTMESTGHCFTGLLGLVFFAGPF